MQLMTMFYVDQPDACADFYETVLKAQILEKSATFSLILVKGTKISFWKKENIIPTIEQNGTNSELAFKVESKHQVDDFFKQWKHLFTVLQAPTQLDFGYSLTLKNYIRVRVYSID